MTDFHKYGFWDDLEDKELGIEIRDIVYDIEDFGYQINGFPAKGSEKEFKLKFWNCLYSLHTRLNSINQVLNSRGKNEKALTIMHRDDMEVYYCWGMTPTPEWQRNSD